MAKFVAKKKNSLLRYFALPHPIVLGSFVVVVAALAMTVIVAQRQSSPLEQHASGSQSLYPANIVGGNDGYGVFSPQDITNPNIAAVDIKLDWSAVEPTQGQFNWKPFDDEVASWSAQSKKYIIVIRFIHEPARVTTCSGATGIGGKTDSGQYLPDWEIARVPTMCNSRGVIIPDYLDPTFQSDYQAYVAEIAKHIEQSGSLRNFVYIRGAVGGGGENYPGLGDSNADNQQLVAWGIRTPLDWENWTKQMLEFYKHIFPTVPIIYPMGYNGINPVTGQYVDVETALWAAGQGLGVGQEGLVNKPGYANGRIVTTFAAIRKQFPNAYLQFTTVLPVADNATATCDAHCVLQADIQIANTAGAFSVEWYPGDIRNPNYQNDFKAWQSMVDLRTTTVTPSQSFTPTPTLAPTSTPSPTITCTPMPPQCKPGSRLEIVCPAMPHGGWCPDVTPTTEPGCYYVPLPHCPIPPNGVVPHYCQRLVCPSHTPTPIQITSYPTCTPKPPCMNQHPRCEIPEPKNGWCPQESS